MKVSATVQISMNITSKLTLPELACKFAVRIEFEIPYTNGKKTLIFPLAERKKQTQLGYCCLIHEQMTLMSKFFFY